MLIAVTDRRSCPNDFLSQIERIVRAKPAAFLLRDKERSPSDYRAVAATCQSLCRASGVTLILHSHPDIAQDLGVRSLHLPLPLLREQHRSLAFFHRIGSSVHSVAEAKEAVALGATHLIAGHIYATGCKPGLEPRGLGFLADICRAVSVPVYAIGSLTPDRMVEVKRNGAAGGCLMSSLMTAPNPSDVIVACRAE